MPTQRDRTIRVWDIASGETTHVLRGHEGSILCLQYDDEILVTGSSDSTVIVWDLVGDPTAGRNKYEERMKLVGHGMGVLDLCFDDRYIVSCSKVRAGIFGLFPTKSS
jgi:WD40 repeat protein